MLHAAYGLGQGGRAEALIWMHAEQHVLYIHGAGSHIESLGKRYAGNMCRWQRAAHRLEEVSQLNHVGHVERPYYHVSTYGLQAGDASRRALHLYVAAYMLQAASGACMPCVLVVRFFNARTRHQMQ